MCTPARIAYGWLGGDGQVVATLNYADVDRAAGLIAAALCQHARIGDRVVIALPQGLAFVAAFFGCLYAGLIAVPAPPLDAVRLKRTLPRLRSLLADATPAVMLTDDLTRLALDALRAEVEGATGPLPVCLDVARAMAADVPPVLMLPSPSGDEVCYLQYSSGSTGQPKGIEVTQANVLSHSKALQAAWGYDEDCIGVSWMPQFHDYGLIDAVLQPMYTGFPCFSMSPVAFIRRPVRWLRAISTLRATHTQAPNFAYDLCVRKVSEEHAQGLDLRSLKVASNGAEPIREETLQQFVQRFTAHGLDAAALHPAYGLAEATLLVATRSGSAVHPGVSSVRTRVVSCGVPVADTKVLIVEAATNVPCCDGVVGEVWVSGPGVARGYWGRPEQTEISFRAMTSEGAGPYLRTGDLGFLHQGELHITGRSKDLIIIDGKNHYPQDIEHTVEGCHDQLRAHGVVAFAVEAAGLEHLGIMAEVESTVIDVAALLEVIRRAIAEQHDLNVYTVALVRKGAVIKTSSGKVQRQANRVSLAAREVELVGGLNCG